MKLFSKGSILGIVLLGLLASCQTSPGIEFQAPEVRITSPGDRAVSLVLGQTLVLGIPIHGSVGLWGELAMEPNTQLILLGDEVVFNHPENMAPGMTGGDAGVLYFTLRAERTGTVVVKLMKIFRGVKTVDGVYTIDIR